MHIFKVRDIELKIEYYQYITTIRISDEGLIYKPLRLRLTTNVEDIKIIKKLKSFEYMRSFCTFTTNEEKFVKMKILQVKYEEIIEGIYHLEMIIHGDKWWSGFEKTTYDKKVHDCD